MSKLYIIRDNYEPNIASINRCLALAKGYGELGVSTEVVFEFPNNKREKVKDSILNVTFTYLWERYCPENKYLKHLFCRFFLLAFVLKLKKNDTVILYGTLNSWYLFFFNRNIKIYNEITEHPSVHTEKNGLIGKFHYWQFKKFCQRIDGILTITPSLTNFFVNEFGVQKEKVCTVNMIVDSTRFENVELKEKTDTITYCGTISERKDGISDLIKSFKIISSIHKNLTLKLIGDFENQTTKKNVYNLLRTLDLQDKVIITGIIGSDQLPQMLLQTKILVLSRPKSTQSQFGFPTKLGEYLMTENPVVITDVGDFKLYLKDKYDVVFAQADNVNDFAEKTLWVLGNSDKAKEIGKNGKMTALKNFNYRIEAKKVLDFINIEQ